MTRTRPVTDHTEEHGQFLSNEYEASAGRVAAGSEGESHEEMSLCDAALLFGELA